MAACLAHVAHADDETTPAQARADGKVTWLKPTTKWNVDYGETRCRLARVFGAQEAPHLLYFEQTIPSASFNLTLAGPELTRYLLSKNTQLGLIDDLPMSTIKSKRKGRMPDFGPALILTFHKLESEPEANSASDTSPPDETMTTGLDVERAARARHVTLRRGERVLSFETGSLRAPFKALNACTTSLLEAWGFDSDRPTPAKFPSLVNAKAVAMEAAEQYPPKAERKRQETYFNVFVVVEPDGSVSSCKLHKALAADSLDSPICSIVKEKGEFEAAVDAQGKPMRYWYFTTIMYSMNP
ncbi:MAG: energy transducer TonB [Pseudomonadota bacterium]